MLGSWIVTAHFRPRLLRAALTHILAAPWPGGWAGEVIVAYMPEDEGSRAVLAEFPSVIGVPTPHKGHGAKRNAAFRASSGALILQADDDDLHSPKRPAAAVKAYYEGHFISGQKECRWLYLATGQSVRWCGRGSRETVYPDGVVRVRTPSRCGNARNYERSHLQIVGGWHDLPRMVESDLQTRMRRRFPAVECKEKDLSVELADSVFVQHDANIWDRNVRTAAQGEVVKFGHYFLIGEGHWSQVPDFPSSVVSSLELVRPAP